MNFDGLITPQFIFDEGTEFNGVWRPENIAKDSD
jgi:hypothetical protein